MKILTGRMIWMNHCKSNSKILVPKEKKKGRKKEDTHNYHMIHLLLGSSHKHTLSAAS